MARVPGREAVYEVADLFRQRCLIEGKSLLWPDQAIWPVENLDAFWNAFADNPDVTKGKNFFDKWHGQLANESMDIHRLATDLMVIYCLFPSRSSIGTVRKREYVEIVRGWKVPDHPEEKTWNLVNSAFEEGLGSVGTFYLTGMPFMILFYLRYGQQIRATGADAGNPDACKALADKVRTHPTIGKNVNQARHALLHLLFPDLFESIASTDHKQRIFDRFAAEAGVSQSADVDEGLLIIRTHLTAERAVDCINFYLPDVFPLWNPPKDPPKPPPDPNVQPVEDLSDSNDLHPVPDSPTIHSLAAKTNLDEAFLREIESLLEEKRQLIFEGPPGSGKTFVAELFARWFTGQALDDEPTACVEIVQFHQSYGYEDFVQGIRPETNQQGQLTYNVRDGIFLELCRRAADKPDAKFVLLIDEINRGNISRIFGELILLLEYRDKRARLPYATGDNPYLTIPKNLYIIGTMNSADRSLAQVDYALRRRFYYVRFTPVANGQAIVLDRWLQSQGLDDATRQHVLTRFVALNERVSGRLSQDYQIGHSFFMHPKVGTSEGFDRIWTRAIQPLLEEYFHHHRDRDSTLEEMRQAAFDTSPSTHVTAGNDAIDHGDEPSLE